MAINTFQHDERTASGHRAVANQDAFYAITHPAVSSLQRKSTEDEELQLKSATQLATSEEDELQMKSAGPLKNNTADDVSQRKDNEVPLNANHTGMPDQLKTGIENLSGYSMDDVKVHYNSAKPAQLNALAYAQGSDIHIAPGQERHLPHEAWHVVQQKQGRVRPTMQMKGGVNVNDDKGLEKEADVMGGRALLLDAQDQTSQQRSLKTSSGAEDKVNTPVQGRFGFEIEVPIFFTKAWGGAGGRCDPGNDTIDQGAFEIKVDHNEELRPLAEYANVNQNGNVQGFPHGPSIIEIVTKPIDEFTLTEKDIKDRADNMQHWVDNVYNQAAVGENVLGGNYYVGSNSPRRTLQSKQGYFQTTYGIKLSSVPDLFKYTSKKGKRNSDENTIVLQLKNSVKAAQKAVKAIKPLNTTGGGTVKANTTADELSMLIGYSTLLANYIIADVEILKGAGLGKNKIGDYFYKTDLGSLSGTLPNSVIIALRNSPNVLTAFTNRLCQECGRAPSDNMAVGLNITNWVSRVINGNTDLYIQALKNPNSAIINSEQVGPVGNTEAGVILENREPQKLDNRSKTKAQQSQLEYTQFMNTHQGFTQDQLMDFLRDATDPKKYPPDEWGSVMVLVYKLLRQING